MGAKALQRRVDAGKSRVQPALRVLGELRRAIEDGRPVCTQLMYLEELTELLLGVEDAVGVVTPAALFE